MLWGENMKTRVRELRIENDMTLESIALKLGVTVRTVQKYESGTLVPPPKKLKIFAEMFDCSIDYILKMTDLKSNNLEIKSLGEMNKESDYIFIDKETIKVFTDRLKDRMIEKELTKEDLAKKFNLSKEKVSNYIQGKILPDIKLLKKFANYFDTTIDYLVGLNESPDKNDIVIMEDWIQYKDGNVNKKIPTDVLREFIKSKIDKEKK
jgi:transcriptional regulator with XRE-family HTH domain